jgi:hypothetical protein
MSQRFVHQIASEGQQVFRSIRSVRSRQEISWPRMDTDTHGLKPKIYPCSFVYIRGPKPFLSLILAGAAPIEVAAPSGVPRGALRAPRTDALVGPAACEALIYGDR